LLNNLGDELLGLGNHRHGAELSLRIVTFGKGRRRIGIDEGRLAPEGKEVGGEAAGERGFADASFGCCQCNDVVPGEACHYGSPESHPPMRDALLGMNS
jgi:hypothetical protein